MHTNYCLHLGMYKHTHTYILHLKWVLIHTDGEIRKLNYIKWNKSQFSLKSESDVE